MDSTARPAPGPEAEPIFLDGIFLKTPAMAFDRVCIELKRVTNEAMKPGAVTA